MIASPGWLFPRTFLMLFDPLCAWSVATVIGVLLEKFQYPNKEIFPSGMDSIAPCKPPSHWISKPWFPNPLPFRVTFCPSADTSLMVGADCAGPTEPTNNIIKNSTVFLIVTPFVDRRRCFLRIKRDHRWDDRKRLYLPGFRPDTIIIAYIGQGQAIDIAGNKNPNYVVSRSILLKLRYFVGMARKIWNHIHFIELRYLLQICKKVRNIILSILR